MNENCKLYPNDKLTTRILEVIQSEIQKEETRQKLRGMVDPVVTHVMKRVIPYITLTLAIFTLILICQGYLVYKLLILR